MADSDWKDVIIWQRELVSLLERRRLVLLFTIPPDPPRPPGPDRLVLTADIAAELGIVASKETGAC